MAKMGEYQLEQISYNISLISNESREERKEKGRNRVCNERAAAVLVTQLATTLVC